MQSEWIIGRAFGCDIIVPDSSVSSRHCRLTCNGENWTLEDLGSSNGTFVNGNRITTPTSVSPDDIVVLGLTGQLPWPVDEIEKEAHPKPRSPVTMQFGRQEIVIGRDPECDFVFDHPLVSRRHARLTWTSSGKFVEDLGSSNGTFVNGKPIHQLTQVSTGDVICLGSFELRLNLQGLIEPNDLRGKLKVEVRSVKVAVPGKTLIEGVTMVIRPGEFVGLMGPSGAGKTTLMNAMNGYQRPSQGEILFNGESLYRHYARFATRIGYVPQDDIIHRDLTVGEALYYTARLRLPSDSTDEDIEIRVRSVLEQLGLSEVRNVLIGSADKKGISGGQRKRVNLAMELLTDPLVLFLDEPTSGLSSEDALMVMRVLRNLADSGKTILLTIHQPSLEVFRLLDKLTIISKDSGTSDPGQLAYFGPAYPNAVHFFNPDRSWTPDIVPSPDEILRGLGQRPTREWAERYQNSEYVQSSVSGPNTMNYGQTLATIKTTSYKVLFKLNVVQWYTLIRRYATIKRRDLWNSAILVAQAPIVAILTAMTFGKRASQDPVSSLNNWMEVGNAVPVSMFILVLSGVWFGCSNSVREIVGEWSIYRRERMVNLTIPAYIGSKFAVLGLISIVQIFILVGIVYFGCSLKGPFVLHCISLLLVTWVGIGLGLTVSAIAKTSEAAIALMPMVLLPMVMLGGVMMPVYDMPKVTQPIANMMPSRWAFTALIMAESKNQPESPEPKLQLPRDIPAHGDTPKTRDMAERWRQRGNDDVVHERNNFQRKQQQSLLLLRHQGWTERFGNLGQQSVCGRNCVCRIHGRKRSQHCDPNQPECV